MDIDEEVLLKDANDLSTVDFLSTPKKRGRPSTGVAKSPKERMASKRLRDKKALYISEVQKDYDNFSTSVLLEQFAVCIRGLNPKHAHLIAKVLISRAKHPDKL